MNIKRMDEAMNARFGRTVTHKRHFPFLLTFISKSCRHGLAPVATFACPSNLSPLVLKRDSHPSAPTLCSFLAPHSTAERQPRP